MKKLFYSQKLAPYVFVLPFALTVVIFWLFPIGNGVLLSFQDVLKDEWVGLGNYQRLLSDKIFLKAVYNSAKYMVGTLVLLIPFPASFPKEKNVTHAWFFDRSYMFFVLSMCAFNQIGLFASVFDAINPIPCDSILLSLYT